MPIKTAFQMEPLTIDREYMTVTLLLMQEAKNRGHKLYHYEAKSVSLDGTKVVAHVAEVTKLDISKQKNFYTLGPRKWVDLSTMDVVWMRQNPPFNMEYITATHMLELLPKKTLVVNDPFWVRNSVEKFMPYLFSKYLPPTLITRSYDEIKAFVKKHKDVVIKPLYGYSGFGVYRFNEKDPNLETYLELYDLNPSEPIIVQRYIKDVEKGNVRVVFFDGKISGVIRTIPGKGEFRLYRASTDHAATLNAKEKKIAEEVGKELKKRGLIFCGIDLIGGYLTEINTTSVGSLHRLNELYNRKTEAELWDVVMKKKKSA